MVFGEGTTNESCFQEKSSLCAHGKLPGICRECLSTEAGRAKKSEIDSVSREIGSELARNMEAETGICPYDVVMVLGAGYKEKTGGPDPERQGWMLNKEFRMRLIASAQLYLEGRVRVICLTGGSGSGKWAEFAPLAQVAKQYLIERFKIPEKDIVLEDQSDATHGNLAYGLREVYHQNIPVGEFAIISTNYHLNRAREMAKMMGIKADFIPAEKKLLDRSPHYQKYVSNWLMHAQSRGLEENEVAKLRDEEYWRERAAVFEAPLDQEAPNIDISKSVAETAARLASAGSTEEQTAAF